jgi:hypothetical protein
MIQSAVANWLIKIEYYSLIANTFGNHAYASALFPYAHGKTEIIPEKLN